MGELTFLERMRMSVVKNQQRIAQQKEIVDQFGISARCASLFLAKEVLLTMQNYLDLEIEILYRLEKAERRRSLPASDIALPEALAAHASCGPPGSARPRADS